MHSNYSYDKRRSWPEHLKLSSSDLYEIKYEISHNTRKLIASNEQLAKENIRVIETSSERVTDALSTGFDQISYELKGISSELRELNHTFRWGFFEKI